MRRHWNEWIEPLLLSLGIGVCWAVYSWAAG
jgi:hypothetical protein